MPFQTSKLLFRKVKKLSSDTKTDQSNNSQEFSSLLILENLSLIAQEFLIVLRGGISYKFVRCESYKNMHDYWKKTVMKPHT